MPGDSVLGDNLVDSLIPDVIDGLRDDLNPTLGVRQYRAFIITRTYLGEFGGDSYTDEEIEITPQPYVQPYNIYTGLRFEMEPCGLDEAGYIILREVSLTYTESQLAGPPPNPDTQDRFLRITDAHGQGIITRDFVCKAPPYADRIESFGWVVKLIPRG